MTCIEIDVKCTYMMLPKTTRTKRKKTVPAVEAKNRPTRKES